MTAMVAAWIRSRHPLTRSWGAAIGAIAVLTVIALFLAVPSPVFAEPIDETTDPTPTQESPEIGSNRVFWVRDWSTSTYRSCLARVEYVGEHVIVFLEDQKELSDYSLNELGVSFDQVVYPTLTAAYGSEPNPGADGEPRIVILIYDFNDPFNDIDGSFDGRDVNPDGFAYTNRTDMFYLNVNALQIVTGSGPALAAHEFSHLLVYYNDVMLDPSGIGAPESTWLSEGFTTYGEHLCGFDHRVSNWLYAFTLDPDFNLTHWEGVRANYGASYAFMSYLAEREGPDFVRALVRQPLDGAAGIDATLAARGSTATFASLFDDWVLTGLLHAYSPQLPPYLYGSLNVFMPKEALSGVPPFLRSGEIGNFGAHYVEFPAASPSKPFQVVFDGVDGSPLQAALVSWDSSGTLVPTIDRFDLLNAARGDTVTGPLGYDRHVLVIWARGTPGSTTTYSFTYSGTSDPPGGIQFLDMGGDDPYYKYVGVLIDRGVVNGREVPAGSGLWFFNGAQNVLRAQFAKMIMEATGELHTEDVENTGTPRFSDVREWDANGYPRDYVEEAASYGIVTGYSDGRFKPWEPIKRSHLVLMITRGATAVGKPLPAYYGDEQVFADVPRSHPYYHEIMSAYMVGIMQGSVASNGKRYLYPNSPASRNHVAAMTANFLAYLALP